MNEAFEILDCFLFEDIINNRVPNENEWGITYNGDYYLVYNYKTGKAYPFTVTITPGAEHDWTQDIKDQEWEVEEVVYE